MKQTAVEWFCNEMENLRVKAEITNMDGINFIIAKVKLFEQAKEIEKEQIIQASCCGGDGESEAEEYYKETFKSDQ
jgi:hypothetical protein